ELSVHCPGVHWLLPVRLILGQLRLPNLVPYTTLFRSVGLDKLHLNLPGGDLLHPGRLILVEVRLHDSAVLDRDFPGHQMAHAFRSEEHTSELQSPDHLVCRLLLEKKKNHTIYRMGKHI